MTIREFQEFCHSVAVEKGWWENGDRNFGELMALCHSELSEAFEEFRKGKAIDDIYYNEDNSKKPEGIAVELADLIIRIFDFTAYHGINMETVLKLKMMYNMTRPYRHGNKKA